MQHDQWVTIPLVPTDSQYFNGQTEIIAQVENKLLAYPVALDAERPTWGRTIPVGVFLLDVPINWTVTSQVVDGETALSDKIIKTDLVDADGKICTMRSIYLGTMPTRTKKSESRRGQVQTIGSAEDLLVVSNDDRVDTTEIACTDRVDADELADHIWNLYQPANQLISGTLPNGQRYEILTTTHVEAEPVAISGGIVIEPTGQPPGIGEMAIGITTFRPDEAGTTPYVEQTGNTIEARSGDWTMRIELYDDIAQNSGHDLETLVRSIAARQPISGLPVFDLSLPLRWSDDELPVETLVAYESFAVRRSWERGCSDLALVCAIDGSMEVVPLDAIAKPSTRWPGGTVAIFTD